MSPTEWEVSGYGNLNIGDKKDHWRVEIVGDENSVANSRVKSLTTKFRLRNMFLNCLLRSTSKSYPEWGFKQLEVACQKKPDNSSRNNHWNIEKHVNEKMESGHRGLYKTSFFQNFVDLNVAMWQTNAALTADPSKAPKQIESKPYQWPLLLAGLRMCAWDDDAVKFYLMGTPVIWWSAVASLIFFAVLWFVYIVRSRRGISDFQNIGNYNKNNKKNGGMISRLVDLLVFLAGPCIIYRSLLWGE